MGLGALTVFLFIESLSQALIPYILVTLALKKPSSWLRKFSLLFVTAFSISLIKLIWTAVDRSFDSDDISYLWIVKTLVLPFVLSALVVQFGNKSTSAIGQ